MIEGVTGTAILSSGSAGLTARGVEGMTVGSGVTGSGADGLATGTAGVGDTASRQPTLITVTTININVVK